MAAIELMIYEDEEIKVYLETFKNHQIGLKIESGCKCSGGMTENCSIRNRLIEEAVMPRLVALFTPTAMKKFHSRIAKAEKKAKLVRSHYIKR